ncbi:MAG: creatininase family protein [Verrucomicrobia bacterium]|nr:creatininase family protein [Verrucomicrobiota bacterium]
MHPVEYEKLKFDEIKSLLAECPVVYIPIGPLEAHGPHGPLGLDALKAHALCVKIAKAYGGAVFPPLFVGQQRCGLLPGNVYVQPETAKALYRDLLVSLERTGFQEMVLLAGHYPERRLIKEIAADFMVNGLSSVLAVTELEVAAEIMGPGDHAGKWETALMLALQPESCDMSKLPSDRSVKPPAMSGSDARDATAEDGERAVELIVHRIGRMMSHLLKQRRLGTIHGALFAQFCLREFQMEQLAASRGILDRYRASPFFAGFREAFWACDFERADELQEQLWKELF